MLENNYFIDVNVMYQIFENNIWYITKLLIVSYFIFYWIPTKVFPQNHTGTGTQKVVYNFIFMVAFVETVMPFLILLKVFSLFLFLLTLLVTKFAFMKWYYKINILEALNELRIKIMLFVLNAFDKPHQLKKQFILSSKNRFASFQKSITFYNVFKYLLFSSVFIYILSILMARGLMSYADPVPDTSQFIDWVGFLQKNILYSAHKTAGADFYGISVIIFFVNVFTNIDPIILFSLYPVLLLLALYLSIYHVVKDFSNSKYVAILAVMIHGLVLMTPLSNIILGKVLVTSFPNIVDIYGLKFYLPKLTELVENGHFIGFIPYIRYISGMAYEHSSVFVLLNAYFLIKVFKSHLNKDLLPYGLTLALVFIFHGGGAIVLVFISILLAINAILLGKINFSLLKRGILTIISAAIIGNLWILSMIQYGIPDDFGNAAPIIDKLLKTKQSVQNAVTLGFDTVRIVDISAFHIFLIFALIFALIFSYLFTKKRFINSSFLLIPAGIFLIYFGPNAGLPLLAAQSRLAEYLFFAITLLAAFYFLYFIYKPLFFILKNYARSVVMLIIYTLFLLLVLAAPRWIDTKAFWANINNTEYSSIPTTILKIEKENQPFSWTVISYVQEYAKIKNKGYHINTQNFILDYNPADKHLEIPTKKIFIFVENHPHPYKGMDEWYYRWRSEVQDNLKSWIGIYSVNHNNIKVYVKTKTITVYEIDNKNYIDYLRTKDKK